MTGAVGEERAIEMLVNGATDYVLKRNLSRLLPAVGRAQTESYEHRKRKSAEVERDSLLKELEIRVQQRTEALQAEIDECRRAEEKFYKSFYSNVISMSISTFPDGSLLDVNDRWCESRGFSREEVIGKKHFS